MESSDNKKDDEFCVIVLDECLSNPCGYGKCIMTNGSQYRCQCHAQFTGNHCQSPIYGLFLMVLNV